MKAHETLPFKLQTLIKMSSIDILYLYLTGLWGFTYLRTIGVSTNLNLYRQRWTITHELGHMIYDDKQNVIGVPHWKAFQEKRADEFAMQILLPEHDLIKEGDRFEWDLNKLEIVFGVEACMIEKRIKQIFNIY